MGLKYHLGSPICPTVPSLFSEQLQLYFLRVLCPSMPIRPFWSAFALPFSLPLPLPTRLCVLYIFCNFSLYDFHIVYANRRKCYLNLVEENYDNAIVNGNPDFILFPYIFVTIFPLSLPLRYSYDYDRHHVVWGKWKNINKTLHSHPSTATHPHPTRHVRQAAQQSVLLPRCCLFYKV